ncbi:MAG: glycosyltransferase [Desulfomonilaceae bacterium]
MSELRASDRSFSSAGKTVSVIIRFHDRGKIAVLDQALFSLATQHYPHVQVIVAVHNGDGQLLKRIETIIDKQPFIINRNILCVTEVLNNPTTRGSASDVPSHLVLSVYVPEGLDGRSILLNEGLKVAEGRYLAFLDYDDVVYPHAYEVLISRLNESGKAVALGGCLIAHLKFVAPDQPYLIENKTLRIVGDRPLLQIFAKDIVPIHTFVVDTTRVERNDLVFDTNVTCYEDYLFLLRLAAKYRFDFETLSQPIAEYRQRDDGTNTIMVGPYCPLKERKWQESAQHVEDVKKEMAVTANAAEITSLVLERDKLEDERDRLIQERDELAARLLELTRLQ